MDATTKPQPEVPPPTVWEVRVQTVRLTFSVLGALVLFSFGLQGIVIFVSLQDAVDFWDAVHWLSESALCILVAVVGCFLEVHSINSAVVTILPKFASLRVALALLYTWVGAFAVGGRIAQSGKGWATFGQVTGVIAWLVAIATILTSCCLKRAQAATATPPAEEAEGVDAETPDSPAAAIVATHTGYEEAKANGVEKRWEEWGQPVAPQETDVETGGADETSGVDTNPFDEASPRSTTQNSGAAEEPAVATPAAPGEGGGRAGERAAGPPQRFAPGAAEKWLTSDGGT